MTALSRLIRTTAFRLTLLYLFLFALFAATLLGAGAVSLLLKGFAWEEAIALALFLFVLLPARKKFLRSSPPVDQPYAAAWFVAIVVVLGTAFWLGLFSYKHLDDAEWMSLTLYDNASRFL